MKNFKIFTAICCTSILSFIAAMLYTVFSAMYGKNWKIGLLWWGLSIFILAGFAKSAVKEAE